MDTKTGVINFFSRNARKALPKSSAEILACSYLDEGLIDSLGIVIMLSELEPEFGIRFSAEDMQSYEFQTIGGLIALIDRLRGQTL
jgi:acyl carrier protein